MLRPDEVEERAAEARALLNNPVLKQAMEDTRKEYLRQLIQADVGSLTAATAHASMKVLEGVLQQLQVYVNDAVVMQRKK